LKDAVVEQQIKISKLERQGTASSPHISAAPVPIAAPYTQIQVNADNDAQRRERELEAGRKAKEEAKRKARREAAKEAKEKAEREAKEKAEREAKEKADCEAKARGQEIPPPENSPIAWF
jgi:membrane protein involved in colicin uptake